jgi:hypothetical protein
MSQEIDQFRRRFLGSAAMTLAAGHLGLIDVAHARSVTPTDNGVRRTHTSFASLKEINAGVLKVGYAEAGPAMVLRFSFCTAGRTTFTLMLTLPRCWRPGGTE